MTQSAAPEASRSQSIMEPDRGSPLYLAGICLVASLGGLLFGFDTAVISGTVNFVELQYGLTKLAVGWFGSAALLGCILGAAGSGILTDRFGRKPMLLVAAAMFFVSALFSCIPPNFNVLIAARIVGGLGVGMASVLAPMYISELSPPRIRGRLVALYQLSIVLGILLAYFSNWLLLSVAQTHPEALGGYSWLHTVLIDEVWRGMFGAEMIPCTAFLLLLLLVPESPRWLAEAGRQAQAMAIFARVAGRETARLQMAEIEQAARLEPATLVELLTPGLRRALIVALGLSIFGQMTGVNIIVYYGPIILKEAGYETATALQWQVLLGFINLVATLVAIWKVDSWGRRPLLVGGMTAVAMTMAATAMLVLLQAPPFAIIILLCLYMGCVAVSICGVIWVLTPEIFPNRVRGRAMSIAIFANWTTNMISVFMFPWYVEKYGLHAGFFFFAGICAVATIFFWRLVPETKGRSLEEIAQHWQ